MELLNGIVSTIIYTALGVALMWLCWLIIDRITPFSTFKEIGDNQNRALATIIGCIFIALAIIIGAVIIS